jgi:opacity protein-like surface antigen
MTRVLLNAAAVAVATALLASSAAAQRIDSPYRFIDTNQFAGLFAGHVAAESGRVGVGPTAGPVFGGRWAIRVSGPFSVGGEVSYMPTTRVVRDTVFVAADSVFRAIGETNMRLVSVMGNLTMSLTGPRTWHGLRPLLSAGAGAVFDLRTTLPEEEEFATNLRYRFGTSFAGHLGAGVEWFPMDRVSLRGDVRNSLWRVGVPEAFVLTEAGRGLPRSDWESNLTLTAGLSIHF